MKKLIRGIVDFRLKLTDEKRAFFAGLAKGQSPDALFITCADSRVVPNLLASSDPGDLFTVRNVGNLVPPCGSKADVSLAAALEFAIFSLQVSDIIVCGHSECGAMCQTLEGIDGVPEHLKQWLALAQPSLDRPDGELLCDSLTPHNRLSQANVLQQLDHLRTYSFTDRCRLHGWWFDIAAGSVYAYETDFQRFILIDTDEAQRLLGRID